MPLDERIEKVAHHLVRWTVFEALLDAPKTQPKLKDMIQFSDGGYLIVEAAEAAAPEALTLEDFCERVERYVRAIPADFDWSSEDYDATDEEFDDFLSSHLSDVQKAALLGLGAKVVSCLREHVKEDRGDESDLPRDVLFAAELLGISPWQPHSIKGLQWHEEKGVARAADDEHLYLRTSKPGDFRYWKVKHSEVLKLWVCYGMFPRDEEDDIWVRFEPVV
jgi:hypothetical protein